MAGQPRLTMCADEPHPLLLANPLATGLAIRALRLNSRDYADEDFVRHGVALPPTLHHAAPARRREFLAGRRCAQAALASLGLDSAELPIGADGAPCWPPGFSGSISHSATWAVAVVSGAEPSRLGVDCEGIIDADAFRDMVDHVAAASELASAERVLGDRRLAMTLVFSAKESAYKALPPGDRMDCDFSSFRVDLSGDGAECFHVTDVRPRICGRRYPGMSSWLDPSTLLTLSATKVGASGPVLKPSP